MARPGGYHIKVLDKALALLDLFEEPGASFTAAAIARRSGLNKTTVFRILTALEDADYLERSPGSLAYRLGFKLYRLGSLVEGNAAIERLARPFLEELKQKCDETVHLVVLHRGEALYLDKIEGRKAIRAVTRVGMKLPAHCSGVGKVLLAHLPRAEMEAVLRRHGLKRFTPNTITDPRRFDAELAAIRRRGYALDDEEIELGLECVAAPIRDAGGTVVAALSISGPKYRLDQELERLAALVLRTAGRISDAMKGKTGTRGENGRKRDARRNGEADHGLFAGT